ncbi:MAG: hypothetical protein JNL38_00790 [Myxococcales bacterium]|nr:hypothetical protein [Myxococcales bacterium]
MKPRVAAALSAVALASVAGPAQAATFGLAVHVAQASDEGRPRPLVQEEPWIQAQIDAANALFAPMGVDFRWHQAFEIAPVHAALETRKDRDALAALVEPRVIDVFVVGSLRDVDDGKSFRMGVCWQSTRDSSKRYVILAATARPTVLAHELGHYFGLGHDARVDTLMSYNRGDGRIFLDGAQQATVKARARLYESGPLLVLWPARVLP